MIDALINWYLSRKVYRQTLRELKSLTEHELRDLGLTRDALENLANEVTYGKSNA